MLANKYLSKIKTKYGIYASLGNHDYQKSHTQQLVISAFEAAGIKVLINRSATPIHDNQHFEVVGIGMSSSLLR